MSPEAMRLRISLPVHGIVSSRSSEMMRGAMEDEVSWHMVAGLNSLSVRRRGFPLRREIFTHLWVMFQELSTEDKRKEGEPGWKLHGLCYGWPCWRKPGARTSSSGVPGSRIANSSAAAARCRCRPVRSASRADSGVISFPSRYRLPGANRDFCDSHHARANPG